MKRHLRKTTPCRLVVLGLAGSFVAASALAQETNVTVLKPTVVTGSYIPTAETVGVTPLDVVGAQAIERVGTQDVLETLKKTTPVFAGSGNYGQSVNNGGVGEAYIAVRNLPTLVLLDGRRIVNSAFSNGGAVDVNSIPIAMIDRIEVLKDGASALYGSDAIGGVVNIITKKNWNGAEFGGRYGFSGDKGDGFHEDRFYVVGGTTTEKASFSAGAQYYTSTPLYAKDREVASLGIDQLLSKGLFPPSYVSPTYPGRVQSEGVSYILAGSPFAVGAVGYNPAITKPPVDPGVAYPTMTAYLAAHPGVYLPIASTPLGQSLEKAFGGPGTGEAAGWPLINTTELGVPSIMGQDRRQFIANGSYELFEKRMELFSSFLYADNTSEGGLAAAPMSSLGNANIMIAADSPVNPFGIDLGAGGAADPRIRNRFLDVGNRVYKYSTDTYQFVGGLKGDLETPWNIKYETAFNYGRSKALQQMLNSPNGVALQLATTANSDPALAAQGLSALSDATGPVPIYNPFALPGGNSPRTVAMLRSTGYNSAVSEIWGADAHLTGVIAPLELPAGKIGWAVGGGFYRESLGSDVDPATQLGQLIGQNQSYPMPTRSRDAYNGWVETRIPITSPDMDVVAMHSFEVTAAGRYETFNPGGDKAVPKIGIRWQPLDEQITLRASYSQSFLAPNVYQLYGAPAVSYDYVNSGGNGQVQMNWVSEPNLHPATAENWSGGIVISPKIVPNLTVSVDYYTVQTEDEVFRVGAQAVADSLNKYGSASEFASSFLFSDYSTRLTTTDPNQVNVANWGKADRPYRNGASTQTDGLDLAANYLIPLEERYGKLNLYAAANVVLNYQYKDPLIGGYYSYDRQYTDQGPAGGAQGAMPGFLLNTGFSWDIWNFTYTVNARYIPSIDDLGDLHPSAGSPVNNYTQSGQKWVVPSWFTIDMQLAYQFRNEGRWYNGTRLAFGVNNITNQDAPLIASSSEDNTDKSTYDIIGRFFYFEVSKKF